MKTEHKEQAKKKLKDELEKVKDKSFAAPVIDHLLMRCEEDLGLAEDVLQGHKTWNKCFKYIYEQARKQIKGNSGVVRDEVVYEWAEDYYRKDDKAEEEKKAKEEAERKKKEEKRRKEERERRKGRDEQKEDAEQKATVEEKKPPKTEKGEIEGQVDIFSMLGM